jgi:fatty-acyl-CoA synthase
MAIEEGAMRGLMQDYPLTLQHIFWRSRKLFARKEIVTRREDGVHRYTYGDCAARVKRLANVLTRAGDRPGDRIGTLAWNNYRHLELYYAVPCMARCCTPSTSASSPSNWPS